jgi:hypothetical protein
MYNEEKREGSLATIIRVVFYIIEFVGFLLPAFPPTFDQRLFVLFVYFLAHYFKLQYEYIKFKQMIIRNFSASEIETDDTVSENNIH